MKLTKSTLSNTLTIVAFVLCLWYAPLVTLASIGAFALVVGASVTYLGYQFAQMMNDAVNQKQEKIINP